MNPLDAMNPNATPMNLDGTPVNRQTLYDIARHNEKTLRHSCTVLQSENYRLREALRMTIPALPDGPVLERVKAVLADNHGKTP